MHRRAWSWVFLLGGFGSGLAGGPAEAQSPGYRVTILHHNDAESRVFNLGSGAAANYGGMGRFKTLLD